MARESGSWLTVCVLFGALAESHPALAYDPLEFLIRNDVRVVPGIGDTQAPPGSPGEKHEAVDGSGNRFLLRIRDTLPIYAEVGVSLLAATMGLPQLPVYPTLVKRGTQGVPASATDGRKGWFAASLQARPASYARLDLRRALPLSQLGELVGHLLVDYVTGDPSSRAATSLGIAGGHVVSPDATGAFQDFSRSSQSPEPRIGTFAHSLSLLPRRVLRDLKAKDSETLLAQVDGYLARLESLSDLQLEMMFGAYFQSVNQARQESRKLPEIDFRGEMRRRIQASRGELVAFLRAQSPRIVISARFEITRALATSERPHLKTSDVRVRTGQIPAAGAHAPEDLLAGYFFQERSRVRAEAESRWSEQLSAPASEVIDRLREQAQRDRARIHFVSPTSGTDFKNPLGTDLAQTHLDSANSRKLFVVPLNDSEAWEIARIAKAAGAHVMELSDATHPHGSKLSAELAAQITERARSLGATDIHVVELPGEAIEVENAFSENGLRFHLIDHHGYKDLDRRSPYSSLEQTARALSYDLSFRQKAIEVNDREFLQGLRELGLSKQAIVERYPSRIPDANLDKAVRFQTKEYGAIYIAPGFSDRIPDIAGAFALREWPNPVNVLVLNGDVRFSGDPRLVTQLRRTFEPIREEFEAHFWGGSEVRSMFWGLKGIRPERLPAMFSESLRQVQATLTPDDAAAFRARVLAEVKFGERAIPERYVDAAFDSVHEVPPPEKKPLITREEAERIVAIADPRARVDELKRLTWEQLAEDAQPVLLARAVTDNSFEIGELLRFAMESQDSRWTPVLEKWLVDWKQSGAPRWVSFTIPKAEKALMALAKSRVAKAACIGRQVEISPQ